jgi:protein gp37
MQTTIEWTWRRLVAIPELRARITERHRKLGVREVKAVPPSPFDEIHYPGFTFNPWRGCEKVKDSPACDHCYAEKMAPRNPKTLGVWGHHAPRAIGTEDYWQQPHKWNRMAEEMGVELNVFCLSLGDWLEDHPALIGHRARLLRTIHETPWLRWLLLTKRPENWFRLSLDAARLAEAGGRSLGNDWAAGKAPANVRIGITAENQSQLEKRLPAMLKIPAPGYFISAEPLLGHLKFQPVLAHLESVKGRIRMITGGESGAGELTRPSHPDWFELLHESCEELEIPFFFKQWGDWAPSLGQRYGTRDWTVEDAGPKKRQTVLMDFGGRDCLLKTPLVPGATAEDLGHHVYLQRVGKQNAGRILHGREWNGDLAVTNGRGL